MTETTLNYAWGEPQLSGQIRCYPEDFQVDEILGLNPDGNGEHVVLFIRKRNTNTSYLAEQIAAHAQVKAMDVSYAGLKDRHAVTTQWFSIYLGNKPEPDWTLLNNEDIQILEVSRHQRKLRRGVLEGNHFKLTIRNLMGDTSTLEDKIKHIQQYGVPNYFGEQRFGFDNLNKATAMFEGKIKVKDRNKRSMYLSAARSQIFNHVLSDRIAQQSWHTGCDGDVMMLAGSNSIFCVDQMDEALTDRVSKQDIFPTGPLWGAGSLRSQHSIYGLEQYIASLYPVFCQGLAEAQLKQERRELCLPVKQLSWTLDKDILQLSFSLTAGSYATSVLRELLQHN